MTLTLADIARSKPTAMIKEMTKGQITESAITQLTYNGAIVWPQNNLAVRGRKFIGRKGVSDIIGFSKAGLFIACEVKTVNDYLSDDQKDFLNDVKNNGGIALVAKQSRMGNVILEEWVVKPNGVYKPLGYDNNEKK